MDERKQRVQWFTHARFGLFIHWGLYAIPARGEWVMSQERIPAAEYEKLAGQFRPGDYDPARWARMAKQAGMRYAVLTAKHHDGFCLFDTKLTDYNSVRTCGRDLVREFLEAFRAEGLKVGLYYSLLDWHHPDYPKYADAFHPMRGNEAYRDEKPDFDRYLRYMHGQVEELVTGYGKLDLLWCDFSYGDMMGEKWKASELVSMVRSHQPHILFDNRLEANGDRYGSLVTDSPTVYSGDFVSPEQLIPPEGVRDVHGRPVPWELCATINNNWGYCAGDALYKSAPMLIRKLVECVSKGGNMLLNVGPDPDGRVDGRCLRALEQIGLWMEKNGRSIYGCGSADIPKPEWGRYTRNGDRIYAHVFEQPLGPLALTGLEGDRIQSVRCLANGAVLKRGDNERTSEFRHIPYVTFGDDPNYTYPLPDSTDTVLEITLKP